MFNHFLVPLDGSPLAECVLPHAIAFARIFEARVMLLGVVAGPHPDTLIEIFDRQLHKIKIIAYLDSIAVALRAEGVPTENVCRSSGCMTSPG